LPVHVKKQSTSRPTRPTDLRALVVAREGKMKNLPNKVAAVTYVTSIWDRPIILEVKAEEARVSVDSAERELEKHTAALRVWEEENPNWAAGEEEPGEHDSDDDPMDLGEEYYADPVRTLEEEFLAMPS